MAAVRVRHPRARGSLARAVVRRPPGANSRLPRGSGLLARRGRPGLLGPRPEAPGRRLEERPGRAARRVHVPNRARPPVRAAHRVRVPHRVQAGSRRIPVPPGRTQVLVRAPVALGDRRRTAVVPRVRIGHRPPGRTSAVRMSVRARRARGIHAAHRTGPGAVRHPPGPGRGAGRPATDPPATPVRAGRRVAAAGIAAIVPRIGTQGPAIRERAIPGLAIRVRGIRERAIPGLAIQVRGIRRRAIGGRPAGRRPGGPVRGSGIPVHATPGRRGRIRDLQLVRQASRIP